MRKLLLVTVVIAMCGCTCTNENGHREGKHDFTTYAYKGHTYVYKYGCDFFMHDPDCECQNEKGLSNEE